MLSIRWIGLNRSNSMAPNTSKILGQGSLEMGLIRIIPITIINNDKIAAGIHYNQ